MCDESTTGLSAAKLARLLAIGNPGPSSPDRAARDKEKAELLRAQLADVMPLDSDLFDPLPETRDALCSELQQLAGRPLRGVLLDGDTDVSVLKALKEYFKQLAASSLSQCQEKTAIALYYAAIASALVFHNNRITKLCQQHLCEGLALLSRKSWIPSEVRELLRDANDACRQQGP